MLEAGVAVAVAEVVAVEALEEDWPQSEDFPKEKLPKDLEALSLEVSEVVEGSPFVESGVVVVVALDVTAAALELEAPVIVLGVLLVLVLDLVTGVTEALEVVVGSLLSEERTPANAGIVIRSIRAISILRE